MRDNPRQIANWLIEEHGLQEARQVVAVKIQQTQDSGDFYGLSVWREVRWSLDERPDDDVA